MKHEEKMAALKAHNDSWHAAKTPEDKQAALESYNEVYAIEDDNFLEKEKADFEELEAALHCERCGHQYKPRIKRDHHTIARLLQRHGNRCPKLERGERPGGCDGVFAPSGACSY